MAVTDFITLTNRFNVGMWVVVRDGEMDPIVKIELIDVENVRIIKIKITNK